MNIIRNLFNFYGLLFILLSHAALLTCRYGQMHMESETLHWKQIDQGIINKCHQLPPVLFSPSEYALKHYPRPSALIAVYTNDLLSGLTSIHDFLILSGLLITIAENLVFYYYVIMLPLWIVQKGIKLMMYAAIILFVTLLIMAFLFEESVDDHHEMLNGKIESSIGNFGSALYHTFDQFNQTIHHVKENNNFNIMSSAFKSKNPKAYTHNPSLSVNITIPPKLPNFFNQLLSPQVLKKSPFLKKGLNSNSVQTAPPNQKRRRNESKSNGSMFPPINLIFERKDATQLNSFDLYSKQFQTISQTIDDKFQQQLRSQTAEDLEILSHQVGHSMPDNFSNFSYDQFSLQLKDQPTGVSKVVNEKFLNQDGQHFNIRMQEILQAMKQKQYGDEMRKELEKHFQEEEKKHSNKLFYQDPKLFKQSQKKPIYTFQNGYMNPASVLKEQPPQPSFNQVLQYYQPLIDQRRFLRDRADTLFEGDGDEDERLLYELFNTNGGYAFIKDLNQQQQQQFQQQLREFQRQKYNQQMDELEKAKSLYQKRAYIENKFIFQDGGTQQQTILGNNREQLQISQSAQTAQQSPGKKLKENDSIKMFLKERKQRILKEAQLAKELEEQLDQENTARKPVQDDPEYFDYVGQTTRQRQPKGHYEDDSDADLFNNTQTEIQRILKNNIVIADTKRLLEEDENESFGTDLDQENEELARAETLLKDNQQQNDKENGNAQGRNAIKKLLLKKKGKKVIKLGESSPHKTARGKKKVKETDQEIRQRIWKEQLQREEQERAIQESLRLKRIVDETKDGFQVQRSYKTYRSNNNNNTEEQENSQQQVPQSNFHQRKLNLRIDTSNSKNQATPDNQDQLTLQSNSLNGPKRGDSSTNASNKKNGQMNSSNKLNMQLNVDQNQVTESSRSPPLKASHLSGQTSRRPIMIDENQEELRNISKQQESIGSYWTPLVQDYGDSKVLMYKNMRNNANFDYNKIMYRDERVEIRNQRIKVEDKIKINIRRSPGKGNKKLKTQKKSDNY